MGALMRATRRELEELSRDPAWWEGVLERIADGESLGTVVKEGRWSWGALWGWVQADEERVAQYDGALKARAQRLAFEALDEAEGAQVETLGVAKLRVDTKLRIAGKWDRGRYGDKSEVEHKGAIGISLMTVLASLPRAGALEREVEALPEPVAEPDLSRISEMREVSAPVAPVADGGDDGVADGEI